MVNEHFEIEENTCDVTIGDMDVLYGIKFGALPSKEGL